MADRPSFVTVTGGRIKASTFNENFDIAADAIEAALGRGGVSENPNSMADDLDMDQNRVRNVASPAASGDAINLAYINALIAQEGNLGFASTYEDFTATASQTLFTFSNITYQTGFNQLVILLQESGASLQGARRLLPSEFEETSTSSFTLLTGAGVGDKLYAFVTQPISTTDPEDIPASDTLLQARDDAQTAATNAATSETNAATSASNAATSETNAATSASNASDSETKASEWADNPEDDPVETGPDRFSAFHWSEKSKEAAEVIPAPTTGDADKMLVVKDAEDGYELQTPAEVRDNLGIAATPNTNILDNPDFSVNQYGLDGTGVTVSANQYVIDRWLIGETLTTDGTAKLSAGNLVLVANSTETAQFIALQKMEKYAEYAGKEVILTARVKTSASNVAIRVDDGVSPSISPDHTGGGSFEILSVAHTFDATPTRGWLGIGFLDSEPITSGDEIEIDWVKLEIGDTATEFEIPHPAEELAKCQRYYYRIFAPAGNAQILGAMRAASSSSALGAFHVPVPMRNVPAIAVSPIGNFRFLDSGGAHAATSASINAFSLGFDRFVLALGSSSMTANETGMMEILGANTAITFDSNL